MSSLNFAETRSLEEALGMGVGYVAGLTNREFQRFVDDALGIDIYDGIYSRSGTSKANRLREFWKVEDDTRVAVLLDALYDAWELIRSADAPWDAPQILRETASRLRDGDTQNYGNRHNADEVQAVLGRAGQGPNFSILVQEVRESIYADRASTALDRLHTYLVALFRQLCAKAEIEAPESAPLNSLAGGYFRYLRENGHIQSKMGIQILSGSIKVLQDFNDVRNNWSLAHDNPSLSEAEANLIVGDTVNLVRFIAVVEGGLPAVPPEP